MRNKPVLTTYILLLSITVMSTHFLGAQTYRNASDFDNPQPIAGFTELRASKEVHLMWAEDGFFKNQILDYLPTQQADASILAGEVTDVFAPSRVESGSPNATTRVAVATGDLDDNGVDELIKVTTTNSFELLCVVTEVASDLEVTGNSTTIQIEANVSQSLRAQIEVFVGNFDDDAAQEFVVLWSEGDGENPNAIEIRIFDLISGKIELLASYAHSVHIKSYDACLADLDLDGTPEIIIAAHEIGTNDHAVSTTVFGLSDQQIQLLVSQRQTMLKNQQSMGEDLSVAVAAGDLDGDVAQEIILALRQANDNLDGYTVELAILQAVDNSSIAGESVFEELIVANNHTLIDTTLSIVFIPSHQPVYLAVGDLNGDGQDEPVIFGTRGNLLFHCQADTLSEIRSQVIGLEGDIKDPINCFTRGGQQVTGLEISDLDRDGIEELVLTEAEGCTEDIISDNMRSARLACNIYDLTEIGSAKLTATYNTVARTDFFGVLSAAMVLGDFNGDNFRLGKGRYFKRNRISQPLIVLNAPPIHFDRINGTSWDVNSCYNGQSCDFASTYFSSATSSMKTSTTISSAWSASVEVEASVTADAVVVSSSIEGSMKVKYGEKFSKYRSSGKRLEISTQVSAIEDDQIYASVTDYDIWEYPVYEKDSLIAHLISVTPTVLENRWFPSKSFNAFDYLPDHEVGNILSYRERKPELSAVSRTISADAFTLSANSQNKWTVNQQSFSQSGSSFEQEASIEAKLKVETEAKFKVFGGSLAVTVEGEYEENSLSTQKTRVSEEIQIDVALGGVNESIGEVKYSVNPYCYWAKNGALVVDYTTTPEVPAPGASDTWWSENYGKKSDPALVLPWQHDPEKGLALQDEQVKRFQSKSLAFSNDAPDPGDTITIYTEVHNWSLLPTDQPVEVGFYLCDPTDEGNRLTSTNGGDVISTGTVLDPRGSDLLSFSWVVPEGLPNFPRIYARLDPNEREDEIHEENNFGFNILNVSTNRAPCPAPMITATEEQEHGSISHVRVYPNPVVDELQIEFEAEQPATFHYRLFNTLGTVVQAGPRTPVSRGSYQESASLSHLPEGLYHYQLILDDKVATGSIIKMR